MSSNYKSGPRSALIAPALLLFSRRTVQRGSGPITIRRGYLHEDKALCDLNRSSTTIIRIGRRHGYALASPGQSTRRKVRSSPRGGQIDRHPSMHIFQGRSSDGYVPCESLPFRLSSECGGPGRALHRIGINDEDVCMRTP